MARMSLPDGYQIVVVPESRKDQFLAASQLNWAETPSPEALAEAPPSLEWGDRTVAVERDGELVAVHASYAFTAPVPGGEVPCSGLTWVSVRPDHRRRGLLSAMIDAHFERSLRRGEPISALFAAEAGIYGRFGYGCAADDIGVTVPRGARLRPVAGSDELTVRFATVDPEVHRDLVDAVHRAASRRPGWMTRDSAQLRANRVADPPPWRDGGEQLRIASVHATDGAPRGYALLRRKEKWGDAGPEYTVNLREVVALDAAATHRLWSFLLDLDLTKSVHAGLLAVDDPILDLLVDRRAAVPKLTDNLWVRLLDLPAALAARRYCVPQDLVLDVADDRLPANAGRWRIATTKASGEGWAAEVTRTDAAADLTLDVRELGAAYLGGRSFVAQAAAGLVTEARPGAAAQATAAFAWPLAPVCSWVF
jgi:predicted acetyltransferase